MHIKVRVADM